MSDVTFTWTDETDQKLATWWCEKQCMKRYVRPCPLQGQVTFDRYADPTCFLAVENVKNIRKIIGI